MSDSEAINQLNRISFTFQIVWPRNRFEVSNSKAMGGQHRFLKSKNKSDDSVGWSDRDLKIAQLQLCPWSLKTKHNLSHQTCLCVYASGRAVQQLRRLFKNWSDFNIQLAAKPLKVAFIIVCGFLVLLLHLELCNYSTESGFTAHAPFQWKVPPTRLIFYRLHIIVT
jgi:hypothetical protein